MVPTLTCQILFVFVVLAHDRRRILRVNVTRHPTSAWTRQQLRDAFSDDATARFLLHDGDATFDVALGRAVDAVGPHVRPHRSELALAESARREWLDPGERQGRMRPPLVPA